MTFRITRIEESSGTILRVAGVLGSEALDALHKHCGQVETTLTLDLSGLTQVDAQAVRALSHLQMRGAALVGASPYLTMRLRAVGDNRSESGSGERTL